MRPVYKQNNMKLRRFLTLCFIGASFAAVAQTHIEGQEYFKADQFDNAKELLTRSLSNASTDKGVANYYLGMIAVRDKDLNQAKKYFAAGEQANPDYAYNYIGQGLLDLMGGNDKLAEESFKQARKLGKKDPGVEIAIARAYNQVDPVKYEKQIGKAVEKARRIDIQNPEVYVFEGDVLRFKDDAGGAAAKYEMAKNYDKNATAAYVKYANLFTRVNPDYAIKMLNELLSVNPNSALGQRELANAFYNKGSRGDQQAYAKAAELYGEYVNNPAHFKSDENRYAFLLFYGGNYQKGYDYATKRLQANLNDFTARRYQFMNAAQIPALKDKYLTFASDLYNAHKANPAENKLAPIDYILMSQEFGTAKEVDKAITVLQEGITELPDNAGLNKQLAMTYVDANDLAGAAKAFKGYLDKTEEPNYNDYIQQCTFLYYAGAQNKSNPEVANKFFTEEEGYLKKAEAAYPGFYKPNMMRGQIEMAKAMQTDNQALALKAAAPYYEAALGQFEAMDPANVSANAKKDAKDMYLYMGNVAVDAKDNAKAKDYFTKALALDPQNQAIKDAINTL